MLPSRGPRGHRTAAALLVLVVGALALTGCGKDEFADKTARVTVSGKTTTYQVDSCGLDGRTAFVVGRSDSGSILQAVVGVKADKATGVPSSTGLSVIDDGLELAGFGSESWQRRGMSGAAPGTVTSARIRGSRIQASGRLVGVDADGKPRAGASGVDDTGFPFTLDARCDTADG
ncbi:hypothetical protein KSP35_14290 [Aquihabitans sp. G128]|uniref:hypothetical protein n=1 Tax=Aquihabitans sp. G128 TaxID=2849779 RepID=UPI001C23F3A5|nr:hypothetical protein [Aquihabitans sp. G128]QXC59552.1 hypothetical protein KSP35_14290 [Aquihabitans sp. G128]